MWSFFLLWAVSPKFRRMIRKFNNELDEMIEWAEQLREAEKNE